MIEKLLQLLFIYLFLLHIIVFSASVVNPLEVPYFAKFTLTVFPVKMLPGNKNSPSMQCVLKHRVLEISLCA